MANRYGGNSLAPFDSMNCSHGVGDAVEAVTANREEVKNKLGVATLLSAVQVHGDDIFVLHDPLESDLEVSGYDALITDKRGVGLVIQHADCQAIMMYDPVKQVIAAVHSGWRGNVADIAVKTVRRMVEDFGVAAEELQVYVSPSLGPCCAEFVNYKTELPESFTAFKDGRDHFDFWRITMSQLTAVGVVQKNIVLSGICTSCSPDYFSYRRACREADGITGRNCSVITLV